MSNDQSLNKFINEFTKVVQYITKAQTNNFFELADMLGQNPKTDFAGANLKEVNLSGGDLRGANLRQADLSGADLSQTDLSGADLTKADLSHANLIGANLIGANLTATILNDARLEDAQFSNNQGLSESMKRYLRRRRANFDFDDSHSKVKDDIDDDNIVAFKDQKKTLLKKHKGEYVAFVDGELKAHDKSEDGLHARVNLQYPDKPKLIKKVEDQEEKIIDISNYLK